MIPSIGKLYDVTEATWPPADRHDAGPWVLRNGAGGGKRVSAATAAANLEFYDLPAAEEAMRLLNQTPLFMIREGEQALDAALEKRGYQVIDPVNIYACPVDTLTDIPIPRVTVFAIWEPLAIMREIWAKGGIGPKRIDVMRRAGHPKTALFGRINDKPAATAFCGIFDGIAMLHALEVLPEQRRQGMAAWMMRKAAFWAKENGAKHLSVICTQANAGANGLYTSLGMTLVGQYHYRIWSDT